MPNFKPIEWQDDLSIQENLFAIRWDIERQAYHDRRMRASLFVHSAILNCIDGGITAGDDVDAFAKRVLNDMRNTGGDVALEAYFGESDEKALSFIRWAISSKESLRAFLANQPKEETS